MSYKYEARMLNENEHKALMVLRGFMKKIREGAIVVSCDLQTKNNVVEIQSYHGDKSHICVTGVDMKVTMELRG